MVENFALGVLDGQTGTPVWQVPIPSGVNLSNFTVRLDGSIVALETSSQSVQPYLDIFDGNTGQQVMHYLLPSGSSVSTETNTCSPSQNGTQTYQDFAAASPPAVDPSGNVYVEYDVTNGISNESFVCVGNTWSDTTNSTKSSTVYLLTVSPDGSISTQTVQSDNSTSTSNRYGILAGGYYQTGDSSSSAGSTNYVGIVIPDGEGGFLATWTEIPDLGNNQAMLTHVSPTSSSSYPLPFTKGGPFQLVLNGNGVGFGVDGTTAAAFNMDSGQVLWSYTAPNQPYINAATSDGGVTITALAGNPYDSSQIISLDPNGNPTVLASLAMDGLPLYSWEGQWYAPVLAGVGMLEETSIALPLSADKLATLADSFWAMPGGNESANGTAVEQVQTNQPQGSDEQLPPFGANLNTNYNSIELLTSISPAQIFSQYIQTFAGAQPGNNTVATVPSGTNVTGSGQILTFTLRGVASLGQGPFSVQVERFDTSADIVAVVTLKGHPLEGWRYWRVFSIGANDVVIETGGADLPGPGLLNYWGYHFFSSNQIEIWHQYLEYIKKQLGASQGSNQQYNVVQGKWGLKSQAYILNNVCQASWCN